MYGASSEDDIALSRPDLQPVEVTEEGADESDRVGSLPAFQSEEFGGGAGVSSTYETREADDDDEKENHGDQSHEGVHTEDRRTGDSDMRAGETAAEGRHEQEQEQHPTASVTADRQNTETSIAEDIQPPSNATAEGEEEPQLEYQMFVSKLDAGVSPPPISHSLGCSILEFLEGGHPADARPLSARIPVAAAAALDDHGEHCDDEREAGAAAGTAAIRAVHAAPAGYIERVRGR